MLHWWWTVTNCKVHWAGQGYESTEAGNQIVGSYHLHQLPAILVIDPITNALVRQWHGFVEAHRPALRIIVFNWQTASDLCVVIVQDMLCTAAALSILVFQSVQCH